MEVVMAGDGIYARKYRYGRICAFKGCTTIIIAAKPKHSKYCFIHDRQVRLVKMKLAGEYRSQSKQTPEEVRAYRKQYWKNYKSKGITVRGRNEGN